MFRGDRLPIVKGRWFWQVGTGASAIPLTIDENAETVNDDRPVIDEAGSLG